MNGQMGAPDGNSIDSNLIGIIAGSAAGGLVLLIGTIVLIVCLVRRRSRTRDKLASSAITPQQSFRSSDGSTIDGTEMQSARADYASIRVINPSDDYDSGNLNTHGG
jgi:hypothetical protein